MSADILFGTSLTSAIDFSTEGHVGQEETPSRNQAYTLSEQFRTGILPSRFFGREEVEKRERNNTHGRVFSADRFTAKHLTMLGLFGVHLSTRRAKKRKKEEGKGNTYFRPSKMSNGRVRLGRRVVRFISSRKSENSRNFENVLELVENEQYVLLTTSVSFGMWGWI